MDRQTELQLIDELLALKAKKSAFLDDAVVQNPVDHYTSAERFDAEYKTIFSKLPVAAAHSSELSEAGAFLRRNIAGQPVLLTRGKDGVARAFLNVCRHRGARLVSEDKGCRHRFTCPYHAWTYSSTGELKAAPHFEEGFPGLEKEDLGLTALHSEERHGFIWVTPLGAEPKMLDAYLEGLGADLEALGFENMMIMDQDDLSERANWKILIEGGIEAYHFRVAHRNTIGPHFEDNLSSYQAFGPHLRSILPRTSMGKLSADSRDSWAIRDHANVLYSFFPTTQFLVMQDHVVWIRSEPVSADETRMTISTLALKTEVDDMTHWRRNHQITMTTLGEDFEIGVGIQAGARSGANTLLKFGRFEGALSTFNQTIDQYIKGA